jgi:hypothetical protein
MQVQGESKHRAVNALAINKSFPPHSIIRIKAIETGDDEARSNREEWSALVGPGVVYDVTLAEL